MSGNEQQIVEAPPAHNLITISGGPAPQSTKIEAGNKTDNSNPALPQITAWLSGAAVMGVLVLAYFIPIISELNALRYTSELKSDLNKLKLESRLTYDWVNRRIEREKLEAETEQQKEQANGR